MNDRISVEEGTERRGTGMVMMMNGGGDDDDVDDGGGDYHDE